MITKCMDLFQPQGYSRIKQMDFGMNPEHMISQFLEDSLYRLHYHL